MSIFKKYLSKKSEVLWTPSELPGLIAWLDADDAATLTFNGTNISQWDNKADSSNPAKQGTETRQPTTTTFNNRTAINFQEDNFVFTGDLPVRSSFIIIDSANGSSVTNTVCPLWGENKNKSNFTFLRTNTTDYSISIDGTAINSGNVAYNGNSTVSGTNINLGLSITDKNSKLMFYTAFTNVASTRALAAILVDNIYYATITIAEVLFLNNIPALTNRQKIEGYLAHKWGMSVDLPANHPYKTNAPYT